MVGETPKGYTQRLRLDRAAARLAMSSDRVVDVALDSGFASQEVFTRAFTRRFGRSPERYRAAARASTPLDARARHAEITEASGPCLTLYHLSLDDSHRRRVMPTIERKELQPQPALIVKRRVARSEIAKTIAESLGKTFPYALQNGLAIAGRPFVRYSDVGHGLMTWAHHYVDVTVTSMMTLANPVVSIVGAWILFDQDLSTEQVAGGVVVLCALGAIMRRQRADRALAAAAALTGDLLDE